MSWLDIFKKKPRDPDPHTARIVNDVPFITQITGHKPGQGKKTYTAKEVAGAGAGDGQVQRLVQVITAKAYIAAQEGHTGIGHRHGNANLLKRAGQQLRDMGYAVRFDPGGDGYSGVVFSPYLLISW